MGERTSEYQAGEGSYQKFCTIVSQKGRVWGVPHSSSAPAAHFLLGSPGIGKTAIMEQIAQELGIALVSYSMTHHTRQSALGLPFITHKNFKGLEFDISEYTMSEIIASVYEVMEKSGLEEGILFSTRLTVCLRRWRRRCCNFCSTRSLGGTAFQTAG